MGGGEEEEAVAEEEEGEEEEKEDARGRLVSGWFSPGEVEKETAGFPLSWGALDCRREGVGCAGTSGIPFDVGGESALNKVVGRRAGGREGRRGAPVDESGVSGGCWRRVLTSIIWYVCYLVGIIPGMIC